MQSKWTYFVVDSADVLARELVEADLLDGCDLLLGEFNWQILAVKSLERSAYVA